MPKTQTNPRRVAAEVYVRCRRRTWTWEPYQVTHKCGVVGAWSRLPLPAPAPQCPWGQQSQPLPLPCRPAACGPRAVPVQPGAGRAARTLLLGVRGAVEQGPGGETWPLLGVVFLRSPCAHSGCVINLEEHGFSPRLPLYLKPCRHCQSSR